MATLRREMEDALPRIDAPTVAEHHAQMQDRLVDAAEELMRGRRPVTAAAVTAAAGIARNSIYRYVDSTDELADLVVARYLPGWLDAVARAMAAAATPSEKVVAWLRSNLDQAHRSGHGWLMEAVGSRPGVADGAVRRAHEAMRDTIESAWSDLLDDPGRAAVAAALTAGLLEAGFRQLKAGVDPAMVVDVAAGAASVLADRLR